VSVQLIVFLAYIREILKREIYGTDKRRFCRLKTKAGVRAGSISLRQKTNMPDLICELRKWIGSNRGEAG
jgi:hypothetical protein